MTSERRSHSLPLTGSRCQLLVALLVLTGCDGGGLGAPLDGAADAAPMSDGAMDGAAWDAAPDGALDSGDAGPAPSPCPRVRVMVAPGDVLNIRPDASTTMPVVGGLPNGAVVEVLATARGEEIGGNDVWYQITSPIADGYIFSGFASCTEDEVPEDDGLYRLPFACGATVRVTQGNGGATSHTGRTEYAFDFAAALDTPIHAMRAGVVTLVQTDTGPGDPCYDGGDSSCSAAANIVVLQHADGATSAYKHLNSSSLALGSLVARGDVIGLSGSTGYSTGPHLHLELRGDCATTVYCATVPLSFVEAGVPSSGDMVTSANCL